MEKIKIGLSNILKNNYSSISKVIWTVVLIGLIYDLFTQGITSSFKYTIQLAFLVMIYLEILSIKKYMQNCYNIIMEVARRIENNEI